MTGTQLRANLDTSRLGEYEPVELSGDYPIDATMISPIANSEPRAYVPLCAALHWIMTDSGVRSLPMNDIAAWQEATRKLMAYVQSGEIELIGCPRESGRTERIPGHTLTLATVLAPIPESILPVVFQEDCPHIVCRTFMDDDQWRRGFNDQIYDAQQRPPSWTHLQISKRAVLERWPRPAANIRPENQCFQWLLEEIRQSPTKRSKSKAVFLTEAKARFPGLKDRQFKRAWENALSKAGAEAWKKPGPSRRSDQRTS